MNATAPAGTAVKVPQGVALFLAALCSVNQPVIPALAWPARRAVEAGFAVEADDWGGRVWKLTDAGARVVLSWREPDGWERYAAALLLHRFLGYGVRYNDRGWVEVQPLKLRAIARHQQDNPGPTLAAWRTVLGYVRKRHPGAEAA